MSSEEIANVQQADPKENGEQEAPTAIQQEQQQHETKEVHIYLYAWTMWDVTFMTLFFFKWWQIIQKAEKLVNFFFLAAVW